MHQSSCPFTSQVFKWFYKNYCVYPSIICRSMWVYTYSICQYMRFRSLGNQNRWREPIDSGSQMVQCAYCTQPLPKCQGERMWQKAPDTGRSKSAPPNIHVYPFQLHLQRNYNRLSSKAPASSTISKAMSPLRFGNLPFSNIPL